VGEGIVGGWLGGGFDRINKMAEFQDFFLKGGAADGSAEFFFSNPVILEFC
jgi:hypothetical protein